MAFSVDSVSPATIPENGGYLIEVICTGIVFTNQFQVYIGLTGTTADAICYSGVPDQGSIIYPFTSTIIRAYTPILDPTGGPYDLLVEDVTLTEEQVLAASVSVLPREFNSVVFGLRRILPVFYKSGPRGIDQVS